MCWEELERAIQSDTGNKKSSFIHQWRSRRELDLNNYKRLPSHRQVSRLFKTIQNSSVDYKWAAVDLVVECLSGSNQASEFEYARIGIWRELMNLSIWENPTLFEPRIFRTLLDLSTSCDTPDAWKSIALILGIATRHKDRSIPILASHLQMGYRCSLSRKLDKSSDFQFAMYMVKLLVLIFPKIPMTPVEPDQETGPQFWDDSRRNKAFFNDPRYPNNTGDEKHTLTEFVQKWFGPFATVGAVKSFRFTSLANPSQLKVCKNVDYLQYTRDLLYFWQDDGDVVEFEVKNFDSSVTPTGIFRLKLKDYTGISYFPYGQKSTKSWTSAALFVLELVDETFAIKATKSCRKCKVSEASSFISLNVNTSSSGQTSESQSFASAPQSLAMKESAGALGSLANTEPPKTGLITNSQKHQVASAVELPSPVSKLKTKPLKLTFPKFKIKKGSQNHAAPIEEDEWDFDASSRSIHGEKIFMSPPPVGNNGKMNRDVNAYPNEEQSPLVLAQNRKQARANKKLQDQTKSKHDTENPTSKLSKCVSLEGDWPSTKRSSLNQQVSSTKKQEAMAAKSITKLDILQLDRIFGDMENNASCPNLKRLKGPVKILEEAVHEIETGDETRASGKKRKPAKPIRECPVGEKKRRVEKRADEYETRSPKELPWQSKECAAVTIRGELKGAEKVGTAAAESTNLESTTLATPIKSAQPSLGAMELLGHSFTHQLQEQIFSSITQFSSELSRKMMIINEELSHKICLELSQKYQKMFDQLKDSFHQDISQMSQFVGDIKDLLHLPEDELARRIRSKKFK
ncbi:LADA_0B09648g1_1 [Lachancea dasiensis]|uniref:LADA_0B09648g1_1 n=1 Tax=Lachancea dasiensis TaxID=1072105 RepID=A0A1G4IVI6_9SACH|nr:LADA_0B09648g1_1 [Lachancea dasiensis]